MSAKRNGARKLVEQYQQAIDAILNSEDSDALLDSPH